MTENDLQGLWRRDWIKAPGFEDRTKRVYWAQAGALYADLRIPAQRPDLTGARALADLDDATLMALMQAEGFAGTITVDDGICTWAREINWHGQPDSIDAGRMSFDANGHLIEDGVHADYRELWSLDARPPLTAQRVQADGLSGILVSSDQMFLLAMGHADAPASLPMMQALQAGQRPDGLTRHFQSEYAFGHWDGAQGIATLCTNPFREGALVLDRAGTMTWLRPGFDGGETRLPLG